MGMRSRVFRWASITKPVTALAALVAAEEGTIDLDEPAGPPGSTIRHLLSHASGLPVQRGPADREAGTRRIYSNAGIEVAAERIAAHAEMPFSEYLSKAVLKPLGMRPSCAARRRGLHGTLDDLAALVRELFAPTLVAPRPSPRRRASSSRASPASSRSRPLRPQRLGTRLRAEGREAAALLRDADLTAHLRPLGWKRHVLLGRPGAEPGARALTDLEFGDWAKEAWPVFSDAVVRET